MKLARTPRIGRRPGSSAPWLATTAAVSAASFAALATAVARRDTAPADRTLGRSAGKRRSHPARRAAEPVGYIGKWWTYIPAALAVSGWLILEPGPAHRLRGRRRPGSLAAQRVPSAAAVVGASVAAFVASRLLDELLPQPPVPPGQSKKTKPVFPSGHALGSTAVAITSAYVLSREGLLSRSTAWPLALTLPVAATAGRMMERRHWPSDVLGGYLAGTSVAAMCLAAYESARSRRGPRLALRR